MKTKDQTISQAEWEIMRVVWTKKRTTSSQIIDVLEGKMTWKPATIKTLIGRLTKKGLLDTERDGRQFIYTPTIEEKEATVEAGEDILSQVCNTKVGQTLEVLIDQHELSQEDIKKLQSLLEEKSKTAPKTLECQCTPGQCDCQAHKKGN